MKARLIIKYQQLLTSYQNNTEGFTLIELLVVVIIIGVLAVISLNTILNEIPKAKQAEAKTSVATINSAQSTYWLTHSTFANNMNDLAIGLPISTVNYTYNILGDATIGTVKATTTNTTLKGYTGAIQQYIDANNEGIITSIICEASAPGNITAVPTSGRPGSGACGTDIELGQ